MLYSVVYTNSSTTIPQHYGPVFKLVYTTLYITLYLLKKTVCLLNSIKGSKKMELNCVLLLVLFWQLVYLSSFLFVYTFDIK